MSFKLGLNRVQEALVVGLMLVFAFAMFSSLEILYKFSIGVIVFTLILLTAFASQILKQAEEVKKQQL